MEAFQFLVYPFLGCVLLVLIHAYFGVHILERGIIFLDLSLAQFIAVGMACSFYFAGEEAHRLHYALGFGVLGASIFALSRQIERWVNIEAFIGVLYVFSFAASILVLDRSPHGAEEFKAILNGNVLWMTPRDLLHMAVLYGLVGAFHFIFRKRFLDLTYGKANSYVWEFSFFLSFALVLVSSVQVAGILQVFAFLIIPSLIGRLYTRTFHGVLLTGWAAGFGVSVLGVLLSFHYDMPTAPVIIACLSLVFFCLLAVKAARNRG